jgi:hypothetical protein
MEMQKNLIIGYEENQAQRLANKVIFRPPLAIWYIIIPVIFVHYFYRLQIYSQNRKAFVAHYMRARKQAIELAANSMAEGRNVNINEVTAHTRTPTEAKAEYRTWIRELIDHYTALLRAKGEDFDELLRLAYRTRSNYLLFTNRLNKTEQQLNQALTPSLASENNDVGKTISLIELQVQRMRREEADRIFQ